ncbi:unnamed protein product [Mytilus edulis]|uniref:Vitelline membrane outer layer 1-like protein n=1 Tax=Mytilus edulis TaxID=6550 RepID=A0A8S3U933_MYTED|nr:unnamed protein product [Mytilus edulis]
MLLFSAACTSCLIKISKQSTEIEAESLDQGKCEDDQIQQCTKLKTDDETCLMETDELDVLTEKEDICDNLIEISASEYTVTSEESGSQNYLSQSQVFEGPCKRPECKLNEICLPQATVDICLPLFAPYGEFENFNGDNSAANYIRFKCRELDSPSSATTLGTSGLWGDYGAWSEYCAVGSAICGLKVRIQLPQGVIIDDTALNDVQFFCCKN